jgi:hypothetical protein
MNDFIQLKDLMPKAIAHYKMERETRAALICRRFREMAPEIVGDGCATVISPKFFKRGVLYVSVPNSLWAQKVYVHRHELLMSLNGSLDKAYIADLRTVVG